MALGTPCILEGYMRRQNILASMPEQDKKKYFCFVLGIRDGDLIKTCKYLGIQPRELLRWLNEVPGLAQDCLKLIDVLKPVAEWGPESKEIQRERQKAQLQALESLIAKCGRNLLSVRDRLNQLDK
jgi:hypothetical protein